MLFSRFRQRRAAKTAALLDDAKTALQQQSGLFEDMHKALATYHATVMNTETAQPPRSLGDLLDDLEQAADDAGTRSRVFDDLTRTHCGKVRSALRQQRELERDLPSALLPEDRDEAFASPKREIPMNRHLLQRIGWTNSAAADAIKELRWLDGQYRKDA